MTSMEFHSPFKLQMFIHGAENLPIADFTTSDPYVTITIGGRLEGRTKTVYRHRNPTWNELFNLKLLHRRSVVILKVFDEDRGQDDDLMGTTIINLAEISLDQTVQKKYPVMGYGDFDTKLSKLEVSVTLRSNESVIKVVPDDGEISVPDECATPLSPLSTTSSLEPNIIDVMEQLVNISNKTSASPAESVVNAVTRFITRDKSVFFSEDLLRDLLDDASSLTKSITDATSQHRACTKTYFNRTALRIINSSKIILATKTCHWHPPLPKNTIQLSLCANDSKFLSIEFCNRLAMWVFTRWIFLLTDFWTGKIKPAELPIWSNNCSYSSQCAVNVSDGHYVAGRLVLAMERPFELRVNDEHLSFKGLHNIILSADSLLPKTDILDVEVVTYSATGEDEDAIATEAVKKGMFQTVRQGIRGTLKGVATGAVSVVSGAADAAVITTLGVANTTVGAARSIVTGKPINAFHAAQDNLFSVGKDIRSILKDATAALGGEASTYLAAKFDNVVQKVHKADHFYVDCNQDSYQLRSMGALRRSSFGLMNTPENPEHIAVAAYPDIDRSSNSLSMLLCHGNDAAQMVVGHKRVSAQWLREKVGQNTELRLDTHLGFSITLLHSRGLQLTPPGKITIGGGGMHVKMKFTDKNGNSRTLGRLQEVKTQSITPNANPDWKEFNVVFKAQDGFEDAAFLRIEICLDDFTTNFVVGTCFIPLVLFRKKSKEVTLPMTRYKLGAVHPRDASVHNCLGETTMRIYRIEEGCGCPALMRFRTSHFSSNIFNTRWFSECVPAGTVNTDNLREVEAFSMLPAQEGLELVSVGYTGSIHAQDAVETAPVPESSKGSPTTNTTGQPGPDGSFALTEDWSQGAVEVEPHIAMIEVYENQRRQPYYPFDWSSKAYTRPLYSDESFNIGYKFDDIKHAAPPQGCSWASEWCLDKKYVETDDNGWNYGLAFRTILSNQKKGKSHTKPQNMMARRRKWMRKVVTNDKSTFTGRNAMQEFELSNCTKQSHNTSAQWGSRLSLHDNSSSHGGDASPSKATHPVLDAKLTGWRNEFITHFPHALVAVCQERPSAHSSVLIPWEQVKDAFVITPSVLSVYVHINRYFPDKGGFFRPAEVEIFVTNCPAAELKSMIEERKWFTPFKAKIRNLVASGTTTGLVDELEDRDRMSETEDYVPDTEELSLGSVLVADLDQNSILLEAELRKIDKVIGKHNSSVDRAATKEKAILLRRDCRLRVYMAALFGVGLKGNHQFVDSEIRSIMEKDFKLSEKIKHETEVATANNRIEFYLDTAEKRIRDAVLCGWSYRGGQLERCLEIFANGYFIEIVGLLGTFFEDTGIDQVKGLGSKVDLINTYMVHNDRLATILDHALRPYALRAQPAATLSLFLDFDILVSWYTSVLLLEMRERVNDVLAVWKDRSKDVTGLASEYKYPVPWIPQYSERGDAQFFTAIPEDLVEVLVTYLQHARIHKETVAPSFAASVGRLDAEVLMAYSSSFLYLAEHMFAAMKMKEWAAATAEEELSEYATWLCSLANDARRVETERLHSPNRVADAAAKEGESFETEGNSKETVKQEEAIERRTLKAFRGVTLTALDHMCCIIFLYVFHDRMNMLTDELYKSWSDNVCSGDATIDKSLIPIIPAVMEDVSLFLQDKAASLNSYCYWKLVGFATDKVCVLYLSLFKIAHRYGGAFAEKESKQIRADIACMRDTMQAALAASLLRGAEYTVLQTTIHEKFLPLDLCCDLLDHGVASVEFDNTMKKLQALAHEQPIDAAPLASLIETFLGLKGVSKYAARKKTTVLPRKSHTTHTTPPPPAAKGHTQQHTVPPPPAASVTPGSGVKRRGSMFDYFLHGGHTPEPTSTPIVSPTATVATQPSNNNSTAHATASIEEDDEEDEDEVEMRLAQQMREQALIECIGMSMQLIRAQSIGNNITKSSALSKSSPLERVFGTDLSSEYDLNVQILHSACPPSGSQTATSTSSYFSLGGAFKGLFGKKTQKIVPPKLRNFDQTPGSPTTPSSDENGTAAGQITVSRLRAEDLYYLDTLRNPHPYLKIEFGKFTATTKVLVTDTTADWSTEEPIVIPLRGIGTSETARSSVAELTISLYYKGYFNDQVIGSVVVEFAPYAPPHFTDRRVVIKDFQSPQAILAAKRAKDEGRSYPSIILSLAPDEVVVVQNPADATVPTAPTGDSP